MEKEDLKKEYKVENDAFKERFQFLLSVNDNIICQRYFKVNGFNPKSLRSVELKDTFMECIDMIKEDLASKSRVFMWYTRDEPIKLTGFKDYRDTTYFNYEEGMTDNYTDNERLNVYDITFKFKLLVDDNVVYETIWDGSDYPKYVRNSVDLTNSDAAYREREPLSLHFSLAIIRRITYGKMDLVYHIIKKICETMSYDDEDLTTYVTYGGNKDYPLSTKNYEYYNGWKNYVKKKTDDYFKKLYPRVYK